MKRPAKHHISYIYAHMPSKPVFPIHTKHRKFPMAKLTYTKTPKNLIDHILAHSTANIFEDAIKEWTPVGFYCDHGKCPCGQPIIQHCIIENHTNQQRTVVGNICVQRFMHINTGTTFTSLQTIMQDISKHPSKDLIAAH